jgi:aromatic ring hydroxylase-like protein
MQLVWEGVSQVKVSYRNGPLARRARGWLPGRGTQPGDRVADIECGRLGGGRTRLHAELGSRWALVGPGGAADDAPAAVAAERLGVDAVTRVVRPGRDGGADVMLVRPHAHLAWRGHDADALDAWLTGTLNGIV